MNIPFRVRYFLSHLLISLLVAGLSIALVFGLWYPAPFYAALGIMDLVVMMLVVDVILGPLLTLLIAKQGKKSLKMDLAIIAVVQLSALFYGLYSIEKGRPVAVVFDVNRFELVQKHMVIGDENQAILKQYTSNQKSIPIAAVRPAQNNDELAARIKSELTGGISSTAKATLWQPMVQSAEIIRANAKPISELSKFNDSVLVEQTLRPYSQVDSFLPLVATAKNMTVLMDNTNKQVVAVVDLRPW